VQEVITDGFAEEDDGVPVVVISSSDEEEDRQAQASTSTSAGPPCWPALAKNNGRPSPQLVGFHRAPSGQATLAFDKRVRPPKAKQRHSALPLPSTSHDGPFQYPSVATFIQSHVGVSASSSSSSTLSKRGQREEGVKISISGGSSDRAIEIRVKDQKTKRKRHHHHRASSPRVQQHQRPSWQLGEEEEDVIILSGDDDDACNTEVGVDADGAPMWPAKTVKEDQDPLPTSSSHSVALHSTLTSATNPTATHGTSTTALPLLNQQTSLSAALERFLEACQKLLLQEEYAVVRDKIKRHAAKLSGDSQVSLASVVASRAESIARCDPFLVIKEVLDELKAAAAKRKIAPTPVSQEEQRSDVRDRREVVTADRAEALATSSQRSVEESNAKKRKLVRRLEVALVKAHSAIQRLEQKEMTLDDLAEEESNYKKIGRYKAKCVQIYKKLAELRGAGRHDLGRRQDKKFRFEGSRFQAVNRKIEKYVDKQMRERAENVVPDYKDVLDLVASVNKSQQLYLGKELVEEDAKATFKAVVQKLKSRRIHDDNEVIDSYRFLGERDGRAEEDPADQNLEMAAKLEANAKVAEAKLKSLFQDYVDKQNAGKDEEDEDEDEDGDEDDDEREEKEQPSLDDIVGKHIAHAGDGERSDEEIGGKESSSESSDSDVSDDGGQRDKEKDGIDPLKEGHKLQDLNGLSSPLAAPNKEDAEEVRGKGKIVIALAQDCSTTEEDSA